MWLRIKIIRLSNHRFRWHLLGYYNETIASGDSKMKTHAEAAARAKRKEILAAERAEA